MRPSEIGAVMPSSKRLVREMVSGIGLENFSSIVELGPGTGVATVEIISSMNDGTRFFVIERNEQMYEVFRSRFPEVKAYNRCASELKQILSEEGIDGLDAVVSGLPWASFPRAAQKAIIGSVADALGDDGVFTTFAYLQGFMLPAAHRFRQLLKETFATVRTSKVVWRNMPPAFVYRCWKSSPKTERKTG